MPFDDFTRGQPISIERLESAIDALHEKRLLAHKQVSTIEGSIQAYQHILDELREHAARQEQPQPGATTNDQESKEAVNRNANGLIPGGAS